MSKSFCISSFALILALLVIPTGVDAQEKKGRGRSQSLPGKEAPHPPKVNEQAPDIELKNEQGQIISLKKIADESPVVLLVLRGWPGYQCPICSRQVSEFLAKQSELAAAGVQVIMVYPGPQEQLSEHAKEFHGQGKWDFPENFHYLTDPDYVFTKAWGLRWEAERETAYPSTFVINKQQKIAYAATSTSHGGRSSVAAVLLEIAQLK